MTSISPTSPASFSWSQWIDSLELGALAWKVASFVLSKWGLLLTASALIAVTVGVAEALNFALIISLIFWSREEPQRQEETTLSTEERPTRAGEEEISSSFEESPYQESSSMREEGEEKPVCVDFKKREGKVCQGFTYHPSVYQGRYETARNWKVFKEWCLKKGMEMPDSPLHGTVEELNQEIYLITCQALKWGYICPGGEVQEIPKGKIFSFPQKPINQTIDVSREEFRTPIEEIIKHDTDLGILSRISSFATCLKKLQMEKETNHFVILLDIIRAKEEEGYTFLYPPIPCFLFLNVGS